MIRRIAAGVLVLLPLGALVAAALLLGPRLGPVIASHWSTLGAPDGTTATWPAFAAGAAVTGLATAGALGAIGRSRAVVLVLAAVAGPAAWAWALPAALTVAAPSPERAVLGPWLATVLVPLATAAAAFLLLPAEAAGPTGSRPRLPVAPGERVAFTAITGGAPLVIAAVVLWATAAALIAAAATTRAPAVLVAAVVVLVAALAAQALVPTRLTIDRRGVRLRSALLGLPLIRVPLADVQDVSAEPIDPWRWGGWGYRISAAGRAYVGRRGSGIVVHRRGGGAVAVTLDDATTAAAVANALLHREAR